MPSKQQILALLESLATASITGVGMAIGGPIGSTIMAGIGINLASHIISQGCLNLKERWLYSNDGVVNHDVQIALARAFRRALEELSHRYLESGSAKLLMKYERESVEDLFNEFKENAEIRLLASLNELQRNTELKYFLTSAPQIDEQEIWDVIVGDETISKYGSELKDFVRKNLLRETLFWFGEELKTDRPDCNRAWRAFQRMVLEGIYADVKAIGGNQEKIFEDLQKLDSLRAEINNLEDMLDQRLPTERFQLELLSVTGQISTTLDDIVKTNARIDVNVDAIRSDVRTLLERSAVDSTESTQQKLSIEVTRLRTELLSAKSLFEINSVLFNVEELLSKNPNHAEARILKNQAEGAARTEARRSVRLEEMIGPPSNKRPSNTLLWPALAALFVLLTYLILKWMQLF